MPRVGRILETALYVSDPDAAATFYERVLGLRRISDGDTLVALDAGGSVLLLFRHGSTRTASRFEGGVIPAHEGRGALHFALAVRTEDLDAWRAHLRARGVEIESEVRWPRGGTSLYFRDLDGHSVELAAPGLWSVY